MADIEQKALELLIEIDPELADWGPDDVEGLVSYEALCRTIEQLEAEKAARAADREQHEAFRQEVSDAVEHCRRCSDPEAWTRIKFELARFITAKPDPLVEAIDEVDTGPIWDGTQDYANKIRAAIEKRGGKITWGEG